MIGITTEEILEQLENILKNAPDQLQSISWEDVSECMKAELDCRRDFYSDQSYAGILDRLRAMAMAAGNAVRFGNLHLMQNLIAEYKGILHGFPDSYENSEFAQRSFFDHAVLSHFRDDTTVVIGDSHVNFFSGSDRIYYKPVGNGIGLCPQQNDLKLSTMYFGPCLAYTCTKPDSRAGFYKKYSFLKDSFIRKRSRLLFSLGEIDLRCHVFKEAEQTDRDYRKVIDDILEKYKVFLAQQISSGYSVYCWGPIGAQKDEVPVDPQYPRYGSETERNTAAFYFTEKLREVCRREGAGMLSILEKLVNDKMETKTDYLSSDGFHLGKNAMPLALPVLQKEGLV